MVHFKFVEKEDGAKPLFHFVKNDTEQFSVSTMEQLRFKMLSEAPPKTYFYHYSVVANAQTRVKIQSLEECCPYEYYAMFLPHEVTVVKKREELDDFWCGGLDYIEP